MDDLLSQRALEASASQPGPRTPVAERAVISIDDDDEAPLTNLMRQESCHKDGTPAKAIVDTARSSSSDSDSSEQVGLCSYIAEGPGSDARAHDDLPRCGKCGGRRLRRAEPGEARSRLEVCWLPDGAPRISIIVCEKQPEKRQQVTNCIVQSLLNGCMLSLKPPRRFYQHPDGS